MKKIVFTLVLGICCLAAEASDWHVPTDGTLRQICADAISGDTIIIADGIYQDRPGFHDFTDIVVDNKSLTIIAANSGHVVIDGQFHDDRFFLEMAAGGGSLSLLLDGLIIKNFSISCITTYYLGSVTLRNCIFENIFDNRENGSASPVFITGNHNEQSTLVIIDHCIFNGGTCLAAGGLLSIYNAYGVIRNSLFSQGGSYSMGGAVFATRSTILFQDCVLLENNSANNRGGAIGVESGNLILVHNVVTRNIGTQIGGCGVATVDSASYFDRNVIADNAIHDEPSTEFAEFYTIGIDLAQHHHAPTLKKRYCFTRETDIHTKKQIFVFLEKTHNAVTQAIRLIEAGYNQDEVTAALAQPTNSNLDRNIMDKFSERFAISHTAWQYNLPDPYIEPWEQPIHVINFASRQYPSAYTPHLENFLTEEKTIRADLILLSIIREGEEK
ncbi:hypothetical protein ACFL2B_02395 [Patescibacteria group bacterium]